MKESFSIAKARATKDNPARWMFLTWDLELKLPGLARDWHLRLCLKCCLRPEGVVKHLLQLPHWNGLVPVCILAWFSRLRSERKDLSHWSHAKGVSPVCSRMCIVRSAWPLYFASQWLHSYQGFDPECSLLCSLRCCLVVKLLPQSKHRYGFSPVCFEMWLFSCVYQHMCL